MLYIAHTFKHIELMSSDRQTLESLFRSPKAPQSLALRVRIVLMCSSDESVEAVATSVRASTKAVYKWRNRFKKSGINGF